MASKRQIQRIDGWGCLLLFLGFGLCASVLGSGQPLFPPGATVLLVSGLPGDVESDNDYRAQMSEWLELLGRSGSVKRLFVLCDEPSSVSAPTGIETKVLKTGRENWLALIQMLKQEPKLQTNSFLAVVWGHGGKQGEKPVFHVRGPRLVPDDFRALAAVAGELRWILMFRGSGSFAREIANVEAQASPNHSAGELHPLVLSSDAERMYSSDPIGSDTLLQIVRRTPEITFEDLSQEFGRAVERWYEERHLARVEEPALWRGQGAPQLLAAGTAPSSETLNGKGNQAQESAREDNRPTQSTHTNELSSSWTGVKRVEPARYPDADAVVLRKQVRYTISDGPALENEQEEFIQILKPEGKQLGDFDLSYSPPEEDLTILDCEVLGPDGKITALEPDAIREAGGAMQGDYQRPRRKFFSLPGTVPGAVLHVRFRTLWKRFPLPHVSFEIPLTQTESILSSKIEVDVPKGEAFHFMVDHAPEGKAPEPDPIQDTYGTKYRWKFENVSPEQKEILAPRHFGSRLLVSTFPDWQAFADWYARISQLADSVTPEISARAAELTKGAGTDREKLVALYNYVTGLRYVAIPLGVNSFRPHAAANVLKNQFGDCKDKANLLNTLLHSLNLRAHLVLVPRFSQAYEEIPGLAFNHAISQVNVDGETVWVDTTDDVCRFGMLPPGDPGRRVLVVGTNATGLSQLPKPLIAQHWLKIHGELDCTVLTNATTDAVPTKLAVTASGYPDYLLRQTAQELRDHSAAPLLDMRFAPLTGVFALQNESRSAISALERDFSSSTDGDWVGLVSANGTNILIRPPVWLPKEWLLAMHHRKQPLFLNEGFPLRLEEEFGLALPYKAQSSGLCPLMYSEGGPLRWRVEWTRVSDDKLVVRFEAELAQGELSEADTQQFQQQLRGLLSAAAQGASLVISSYEFPNAK
jgi:hypothetical protein